MTRNRDLEPILQPWMERNALPAPDDLMPRVMREVESVSQRTGTRPSLLAMVHGPTWAAAAIAAIAIAVASGAYFVARTSPSTGGAASPTPEVSAAPATTLELVDAADAAWNAHDGAAAARLYAKDAQLRIAQSWPTWTETYTDAAQISATITERAAIHFSVSRTGVVRESSWNNGSLLAFPSRYETGSGTGYGFVIYQLSGMKIQYQWIIGLEGAEPTFVGQASTEMSGFFSRVLAAWGSGNGTEAASYYTIGPDPLNSCDVRLAIGRSDWSEEYVGREAIAQNVALRKEYDFQVHELGTPTAYGDLFLLPAWWESTKGAGDLMVVFQLNPEHTAIIHEWGFGS